MKDIYNVNIPTIATKTASNDPCKTFSPFGGDAVLVPDPPFCEKPWNPVSAGLTALAVSLGMDPAALEPDALPPFELPLLSEFEPPPPRCPFEPVPAPERPGTVGISLVAAGAEDEAVPVTTTGLG